MQVSGYGRQPYLREGGKLPRVDADNIEYALNRSLERLGTDYVDLLQIHWPDRYVPLFGEQLGPAAGLGCCRQGCFVLGTGGA